ncbi:MAG: hypothetical protein M9951_17655 [Burkholderiaceae bacterium]|nr:hypothetical protein [Burkholderiaceae bacterium]
MMKRRVALGIALSIAAAILVSAGLLPAPAHAQVVDHLGVPGPIRFDGSSYELAWSSRASAEYTKQEYVPAGQEVQSYERMLLLERLAGKLEPIDAARTQMAELEKRKASDPLVNMNLIQNPRSNEVLLDFIVSARDKAGDVIVEWNAYRYAPAPAGKPGIVLFGVSYRAYGTENAKTFLGQLKTLRPERIRALTEAVVPSPR